MKGIITDIHRTSVVDGPGLRTSVFMKGCPLRCIWCHNPETQHLQIEAGFGREMELDFVLSECEKDRVYYDESGGGVTLSGGEPLMQADFTLELLKRLKEKSIHTTLDTCGYTNQSLLEQAMAVTDLFLFDYKATDSLKHSELVKAPLQPILDNLDFLLVNHADVILRCPLVPNVNDDAEHLGAISEMEKRYPGLLQIEILPWHNMGNSKYPKLGKSLDSRLPELNVSSETIHYYTMFFSLKGNRKVIVKA